MKSDHAATQELLSHILRKALGMPCPCPAGRLSQQQFREIEKEAARQTVSGLLYHAVISKELDVDLSPNDAVRVLTTDTRLRFTNKKIDDALISLTRLLQSRNIRFVVVKGQTIAALYPEPYCREPGDIDFYVWPEDFSRARHTIEAAWHIEMKESEEQHISFTYDGVLFEMHFLLLKLYSRRRQEAFDRMIAASRPTLIHVGDAEVPVLDEIPNIVYTFAHLWYHFVELGVGLRQLCDLAILINRSFPCDLDEKCLQARTASLIATLDSLEMRGAFAIVECVMHDYLGLTRLPLPVSRSVQAMSGIMTKRIFKYGNFGKYGRNGQRGEWKFYARLLADRIITILRFRNYDKKELSARLIKEVPSKMWRVISGRAAED